MGSELSPCQRQDCDNSVNVSNDTIIVKNEYHQKKNPLLSSEEWCNAKQDLLTEEALIFGGISMFDGRWHDVSGEGICHIISGVITWEPHYGNTPAELQLCTEDRVVLCLRGIDHVGELDDLGSLHWDDDDVWLRSNAEQCIFR